MKNTMELLQELDEAIHSLKPMLEKDDENGEYLHENVKVRASVEQLQELIDDLKKASEE